MNIICNLVYLIDCSWLNARLWPDLLICSLILIKLLLQSPFTLSKRSLHKRGMLKHLSSFTFKDNFSPFITAWLETFSTTQYLNNSDVFRGKWWWFRDIVGDSYSRLIDWIWGSAPIFSGFFTLVYHFLEIYHDIKMLLRSSCFEFGKELWYTDIFAYIWKSFDFGWQANWATRRTLLLVLRFLISVCGLHEPHSRRKCG